MTFTRLFLPAELLTLRKNDDGDSVRFVLRRGRERRVIVVDRAVLLPEVGDEVRIRDDADGTWTVAKREACAVILRETRARRAGVA